MATTLGTLSALLDAELHGDADCLILDGSGLDRAGSGDITYIANAANVKSAQNSGASAFILERSLEEAFRAISDAPCLLVEDALFAFLEVLHELRPPRIPDLPGVSASASISPRATVGPDSHVYPGAYIDDDAVIGSCCRILPGAYVGAACRLGDHVTIHPHVVLYADTIVGNRVTIHANSVIGADGFGYRVREGRHIKLPHFGNVLIGDDVEIGACTTIDRAMVGTTSIGEGTKLDNLVMIAHNCELGRHNVLVSQVGLAGSVTTGDYVVCAGQVGVGDHVHLGSQSVFGAKAGVHKDMPGNTTYLGAPAVPEADAMRNFMALRKLPGMRQKLRELERKVSSLTARLDQDEPGDQTQAA